MHYNVYTQCISNALQCIYRCTTMYITDIHCVPCTYTLGYTSIYIGVHTYIHCVAFCVTQCNRSMLPNVYTCYTMYIPIYIVYIHCVTFAYTLCCKPYTLCYIFCHTMYIEEHVTQCIYVQMHYNVYTQCI